MTLCWSAGCPGACFFELWLVDPWLPHHQPRGQQKADHERAGMVAVRAVRLNTLCGFGCMRDAGLLSLSRRRAPARKMSVLRLGARAVVLAPRETVPGSLARARAKLHRRSQAGLTVEGAGAVR